MKELRARASSLMKEGHWEPAAEALAELVELSPDDVWALASFSNVLLKLQRLPEAAATAARVAALSPGDAVIATRALRLLLRVGDLKSALEAAERCRDLWCGDATLARLSARALTENGRASEALELLRGALRRAPDLADIWHEAVKAAEAANDRSGAFELALEGARRHAEDLRLQKLALRLALEVADKPPDLLAMARSAVQLAPENPSILRLAGRTCGQAGRWSEAVTHLQKAADLTSGELSALTALLTASEQAKDFERAADAAARITELQPDDPERWRRLAEANWRARRETASRVAFARSVALRAPDMPDDLASGLHALWRAPRSHWIRPERLQWAYSVQSASREGTPIDREAWDRAMQWGADAHSLLVDWQEVRPERHEEMARLTDLRGLELLERPIRDRKGACLINAHLGPVFASPVALYSHGLPFRWLNGVPSFPGGPVYERLISPRYARGRSALAQVHATLSGGRILLATMDLDERRPPRTPFLGQTIWVNETAARMIHWTGAEPLFLDGRWEGERMVFRVLPMVAPEKGESADAYLVRWTQDYLGKLTDIMTSEPENLYCPGGLWRCIRADGGAQEPDSGAGIDA